MKALRIVCTLLLITGACVSGRALYMHAKAELAGILVRRAWEQSVRSGRPQAPWPWADTHPVGRLRIPRLGYDEIVLEGATPRTLAFGPARLFSGANMGGPGNLVLAGHRTSRFLPLQGIRPMIETVPLANAAEAYGRMMRNEARFRIVLVTGQ